MRKYGFIISGVSQIISYLAMAIFLYFYGRKIANLKIKLKNSAVIVLLLGLFIFTIYFINSYIILGNYYYLLILSFLFGIAILTTYFMQHKLNLRQIVMGLLKRT